MSVTFRLVASFSLLLLASCNSQRGASKPVDAPAPAPEVPVAAESELLDGFEGPAETVWAFDSADDEADASYKKEGATQGAAALGVALRGKGLKGKLHLRREVLWNLSKAAALRLDVTSPAAGLQVALAFKADPGEVYQESKPVTLQAGLNRGVRFPLAAPHWKHAKTDWAYSGAPVNLGKVVRVMVLLFPGETEKGAFVLDNLRVEGEAEAALRAWRPEFLRLSRVSGARQYEPLELGALFRASYTDYFDRSDIAAGVTVTPPDGRAFEVPAFFAGVMPLEAEAPHPGGPRPPPWGPFLKKEADEARAEPAETRTRWPVWLARFTPARPGRYLLQWRARNSVGETRAAEQELHVLPYAGAKAPPGCRGGNVRISRVDPRRFELEDGSPFFVLGQNVCWTTDWAPYLERIAEYGGNACRIWLCPWGVSLERKTEPYAYDLDAAERLDELFKRAEAAGVRIVFCFTFHGATRDFWGDQPYNRANGGPCARPEEFFTDRRARAQFKRLLEYAAARWGCSPALLAWEVINEADLAGYDREEDAVAWVLEMAGHLKAVDAHGHLVTASTTRPEFGARLWDDPRIDFVSGHAYGFDAGEALGGWTDAVAGKPKPFVLAEYGGGWLPQTDQQDKDGRRLQAALWLSACAPAAGCALPWWWDTQIEAFKLYPRFAAVGRFLKGEERRGRYEIPFLARPAEGVEARGILDAQGGRVYLFNPAWARSVEAAPRGPLFAQPAELPLQGLLDGTYRVEYWDAEQGEVFQRAEAEAKGAKLNLALPARAGPYAVKFDRAERLTPGVGK
ncbi:MAG: hypothetical protein M5U26_01115 [Planctomycetota bacterium]|nr:hypothetical protein [Planctomycetota bacterium]